MRTDAGVSDVEDGFPQTSQTDNNSEKDPSPTTTRPEHHRGPGEVSYT